jgi:hypothetical protein
VSFVPVLTTLPLRSFLRLGGVTVLNEPRKLLDAAHLPQPVGGKPGSLKRRLPPKWDSSGKKPASLSLLSPSASMCLSLNLDTSLDISSDALSLADPPSRRLRQLR